jgi:hypothetical protein
MCGLIGFSGQSPFNPDKIRILMLANMTRGVDATGMYTNGTTVKQAGNAIEFLAKNDVGLDVKFLGHCRASTFGAKGDPKNAHPFHYGDTIGMHNGTLKSLPDLAKIVDWKYADYEVDSQILVKAISVNKQIEAFKQLDGAAAVIWTKEDEPTTIYCYRNDERPLYRGVIAGEGMYLSSIEDSLHIIGCTGIKEVKIHCIYKITNGEIEQSTPIVIPVKKKEYSNYGTTVNYENDYPDFDMDDWAQCKNTLAGFTPKKWYRVMNVPTSNYIDIENDAGTLVSRGEHLFRSTTRNIKKGAYVVVEEELSDNSPCKQHDILFCKDIDGVDNVLHCAALNDWSQVLLVPKSFCRATEPDEDITAIKLLKEYAKKDAMDITKRKEATELLELAECMFINANESLSKATDIGNELDMLIERIEGDPQIESSEVLSDLATINGSLEQYKDWIRDDSIAMEEEDKELTDVLNRDTRDPETEE